MVRIIRGATENFPKTSTILEVWFIVIVPVLWICNGFNADPDPAFYLNADTDPGNQDILDPDSDPGQTLTLQKAEFFHEKYTLCTVGNLVNFLAPGSGSGSVLGMPNLCGSGSVSGSTTQENSIHRY
jgi:hypothetical protein